LIAVELLHKNVAAGVLPKLTYRRDSLDKLLLLSTKLAKPPVHLRQTTLRDWYTQDVFDKIFLFTPCQIATIQAPTNKATKPAAIAKLFLYSPHGKGAYPDHPHEKHWQRER